MKRQQEIVETPPVRFTLPERHDHEGYEQLIERCQKEAEVVPTAVAHPCDETSLSGAVEAAEAELIAPILVGPPERIQQVAEGAAKPKPRVVFEQGDHVRVVDGAFANFTGTIEEVNHEKHKVRVLVSIFGRATPVELDYIQVEKTN